VIGSTGSRSIIAEVTLLQRMRPPQLRGGAAAVLVRAVLLLAVLVSTAAAMQRGGDSLKPPLGSRRRGRILAAAAAAAAPLVSRPTGLPYNIGNVSVQDVWVDPARGSDGNSGASRAKALRTLAAAWARVPQRRALTRGFRIRIAPGRVTQDMSECWIEGLGCYPRCIIECHESIRRRVFTPAAAAATDCAPLLQPAATHTVPPCPPFPPVQCPITGKVGGAPVAPPSSSRQPRGGAA
jgi:hypothetical protein